MSNARIAVLDIESKPALGYVWQQWQTDMHNPQIVEPVSMLCFASKWVGEKGVEFHSNEFNPSVIGDERIAHKAMVMNAWDILDKCDALVTYNGDRYDIPHLNREFAMQGFGPPSPYKSIDLFRVAKRLKFFSHKLDYVADQLSLGRKLDTGGFKLWLDVMAGDEKAWRKFEKYNKHDVVVTERLYKELLPWIKSHLNLNLFSDGKTVCPNCGSGNLQSRGTRVTAVGRFARFQCQGCGAWSSSGKRLEGADVRGVS